MSMAEPIYARLVGVEPDEAERREAGNGFVHLASLSLTKIADGLIDPKLVLAWLMTALGAPGALIGALVPVREAGALLPQLALAKPVQESESRKWFWIAGSAVQGLAALGIAASALLLEGVAAGVSIVGCLAILACARSLCSISYKDALARSIPKTRRGAITGAAASAASTAVLLFGAALAIGLIPLEVFWISTAIALAGAFWLAGAALFTRLKETPEAEDAPEDGGSLLAPLRDDPQLRRFIAARALLTATALAPPFLVMLSGQAGGGGIGQLGPLVLASAAASILSAYVWGRLSDRSSRRTLTYAGLVAAAALGAAAISGWLTGGLFGLAGFVAVLFTAQIGYEGVRAGRKLHLTDMTDDAHRARYTAVSNGIIGAALLLGGGFGVLADLAGPAIVLGLFALISLAGAAVAAGLDEVQER